MSRQQLDRDTVRAIAEWLDGYLGPDHKTCRQFRFDHPEAFAPRKVQCVRQLPSGGSFRVRADKHTGRMIARHNASGAVVGYITEQEVRLVVSMLDDCDADGMETVPNPQPPGAPT